MNIVNKIRVAIAGGTGYTGGELFRILLNHPNVEIVSATTTSSEGTRVDSVHRDLIGETDLCFTTDLNDPDVIFLCHRLFKEPPVIHRFGKRLSMPLL